MTSAARLAPDPSDPTMSRLSSGNCSSVCLRRLESGRGPLPPPSLLKAALNGSRMPCAAYSKVSNCCITGNGSSGGAGRARTLAAHSSRFGAPPGSLVRPRPQPPTAAMAATRASPRMAFDVMRMSAAPPGCSGRGFLGSGFFLVQVAIGLHRAGQFERRVGADAGTRILVGTARTQLDVVHGHDHHARQRGHAADKGAELVVAADHAQRDRLLGIELLGGFRTGLEKLVLDAGGQRGLRDVDDEVGHLGAAGQLAQHLLQLLFHLRQLELERLQVGGAALLGLEFGAQVGLGALQAFELVALFTREHPPRQAEDQQADDRAETDLVLARPGTDVVEIKFLERHLALAHDAAPSSAAGTASSAST